MIPLFDSVGFCMEIYLLELAVLCDPLEEFEEVCPGERCLLHCGLLKPSLDAGHSLVED